MVFASVWPILTVIFIISALLKLVYKLIKEERAPNLFHQQPQTEVSSSSEPQEASTQSLDQQLRQDQQQLERHQNGRPADSITSIEDELQQSDTCSQSSNWSGSNRCHERYQRQPNHEPVYQSSESDTNSSRSSTSTRGATNTQSIGSSQTNIKQKQQQLQQTAREASPQRLATALALISDFYLVEPCKFFLNVFTTSVRLFWCLLDAIEGIESAQVGAISSSVGNSNQTHLHLQQQRSPVDNWRQSGRSNYFHRRYRSRRSLSAALLDDLDWSLDTTGTDQEQSID